MSYTFKIGEATVEHNLASCVKDGEDPYASIYVKSVTHKDAPQFPGDEMNHGNDRSPGYGQWAGFVKECKLGELFPTEDNRYPDLNLIPSHPGAALITAKHLEVLRRLIADYEKVDTRPAGLDLTYDFPNREPEGYVASVSYNKVRLAWLEFWMDWALKNCKVPTFYNS